MFTDEILVFTIISYLITTIINQLSFKILKLLFLFKLNVFIMSISNLKHLYENKPFT